MAVSERDDRVAIRHNNIIMILYRIKYLPEQGLILPSDDPQTQIRLLIRTAQESQLLLTAGSHHLHVVLRF